VSPDGYVLTNYHVIENADDIQVALSDRREFKARIVGVDPKTDLAVLSLQGQGFPVVPFGDSDRVEVAEPVIAIGNPFGLDRTVTLGIVSALGRANIGIVDYEDFIQTDAAINPGNSGGALINARGELIGINTAIFSESGGYAGIGFAVPVNMARIVLNQIITYGRMRRGWLGVMIQELTPALARGLGIPGVRGILIADVADAGPANHAGLQREDVVVHFEGKPVDDTGHFRNLVAEAPPGKKIVLGILRAGRPQTITLTVGELPDTPATEDSTKPEPDQIGVTTIDLTPDMAKRLGLPFDARGAVITDVLAGGRAQHAGLQAGDVIQEANHQPIRTARDFRQLVEQSRDHDVILVVKREGTTIYFALERLH
jgi:serine protease Do